MKPLLLWAALLIAIAALAACATAPQVSIPEIPVPTRTIRHAPTRAVPYEWTEEHAIGAHTKTPSLPADLPPSWRETLYDGERVIEPRVVLNGRVLE